MLSVTIRRSCGSGDALTRVQDNEKTQSRSFVGERRGVHHAVLGGLKESAATLQHAGSRQASIPLARVSRSLWKDVVHVA